MRLPQKMEKDVNAVIVEGAEFSEALDSTRLRLQVLTLVRGVAQEDLDTSGIKEAVEHIRAGCPVSATSQPTTAPRAESSPLCSDELLTRLRAAGVTQSQIQSACGTR